MQTNSQTTLSELREALESIASEMREMCDEIEAIRHPVTRRIARREARQMADACHRRLTIDLWKARFQLVTQQIAQPFHRLRRQPCRTDSPALQRQSIAAIKE